MCDRVLLSIACLAVFAQASFGQDASADVKIHLKSPQGWRGEAIKLPPGFAPDMSWKGLEEVRFAPGMFQPNRDDFFSYVFVFYLPSSGKPDQKVLQRELLKYYRGLATAVAKRKGGVDAKSFKLTLKPVSDPDKPDKKREGRFTGELEWTEPFATMKPQQLHFEIQSAPCPDRKARMLSVAVSPKTPEQAKELWKTMRGILKTVEFRSADSAAKPRGND